MRRSTGIFRYRSSLLWSCRSSHQVAPASASVAIVSRASAGSAGLAPPRTISNGASARSSRCSDVGDQVTNLVDGWDVPVPGTCEQGNGAVPACRAAHGPAMWPESTDPDRRSRPLHRRGKQFDIPDVVVAPIVVHPLARPVASQQFQAFVEALGQHDRVGRVPEAAELVLDRPARPAQKITLPPLRESKVATWRASCSGLRRAIGVTIVPSLRREVASAAAVRSIHGSPNG